MTNIYLNDDLACQADHTGDTHPVFFGGTDPGACGTFLSTGGVSYGPTVPFRICANRVYTGQPERDQRQPATSATPIRSITSVNVPSTTLDITQTDRYVAGQQVYRTDIAVTNTAGIRLCGAATLYHAADCFLQELRRGYGFHDADHRRGLLRGEPQQLSGGPGRGFRPSQRRKPFLESGFAPVWSRDRLGGTQFPGHLRVHTFAGQWRRAQLEPQRSRAHRRGPAR